METIKKKIEVQSSKDTEVAPAVQIVPEEEYMEFFGTGSDDRTKEGEELQERNLTEEQQAILFIIKEVLKSRTREALPITEGM